ncbi:Plasmodium exported protein (Pm-fam-a like), unknown function [Plasmodium malariae]|uniref:Fam-m protein n=1 Tax=Plasmodium malariae TaxID=5858 RepID=A0A1A8WZ02_PLAMA|nr:Plasmodium exported protein (Pm-fam-a like), unknown function [Plasmodium malariae]
MVYYTFGNILDARSCRLLARYKQDKGSNNVKIRNVIANKGECKKRNISNNKEEITKNKKNSYRNLLNRAQFYTEVIDYNNGMFDGKHFHFEKKWIKKKDYDNYLEKKRRIRDIGLKKIKFRNYGFGVAIYFLFFLLGIGLPIYRGFELSIENLEDGRYEIVKKIIKLLSDLTGLDEGGNYILFFGVAFIMLAALIIVATYRILRNNEKYNKLKLMTRENE